MPRNTHLEACSVRAMCRQLDMERVVLFCMILRTGSAQQQVQTLPSRVYSIRTPQLCLLGRAALRAPAN